MNVDFIINSKNIFKMVQREILEFLEEKKGQRYTTKELSAELGFRNKRSVVMGCKKLREFGLVKFEWSGSYQNKTERCYWV